MNTLGHHFSSLQPLALYISVIIIMVTLGGCTKTPDERVVHQMISDVVREFKGSTGTYRVANTIFYCRVNKGSSGPRVSNIYLYNAEVYDDAKQPQVRIKFYSDPMVYTFFQNANGKWTVD